jgi:hypothetical protein
VLLCCCCYLQIRFFCFLCNVVSNCCFPLYWYIFLNSRGRTYLKLNRQGPPLWETVLHSETSLKELLPKPQTTWTILTFLLRILNACVTYFSCLYACIAANFLKNYCIRIPKYFTTLWAPFTSYLWRVYGSTLKEDHKLQVSESKMLKNNI